MKSVKKRPYRRPELRVYGDISEITLARRFGGDLDSRPPRIRRTRRGTRTITFHT